MLSWDNTPTLSPMRCSRAWIEINLAALAHNVRSLKALLPEHTALMSVVKADAYGHGAISVARVALRSGASWLGVATVPEGIELRQAGIEAPILVMGAVNNPEEVVAIAHWKLQPTIVNPKQALVFSDTLAKGKGLASPLPVHIKLDTGMSRLGFSWEQPAELVRFVQQLAHLETVSVYSHLATADSPDLRTLQQQHERFESAIATLRRENLLPAQLHLANSAATLVAAAGPLLSYPTDGTRLQSSLHYDMVRIGLATYGLYPAPHLKSAAVADLRPVLEVKARITHLKNINPGDGVSYGHRFVASDPMKIAVVGIGYADGIPRILSNRLQVVVNGQRVCQIGAITMDQLMLDVSGLKQVQEGDIVTLLGRAGEHVLSADRWAEMAGTISWEILCGFKHRLPRIECGEREPNAVEIVLPLSPSGLKSPEARALKEEG
ncbi:MAG: alanine racemase [Cyanobacteria bacterium J06635_11]